jgi:hypothetical protein
VNHSLNAFFAKTVYRTDSVVSSTVVDVLTSDVVGAIVVVSVVVGIVVSAGFT